MATVKSYTDLKQSKRLAEILPHESADAFYDSAEPEKRQKPIVGSPDEYLDMEDWAIPCWSLAALLNVIPKHIKDYNVLRIDISNDFAIWYDEIGSGVNNDLPNITMESAVDACYEMILKLHELKAL